MNIYTNKKYLFCFEFELLEAQPCCLALYQWKTEKGWLVTFLMLLPHIPHTLFMTSLMQTAGRNMAAAKLVYSEVHCAKITK